MHEGVASRNTDELEELKMGISGKGLNKNFLRNLNRGNSDDQDPVVIPTPERWDWDKQMRLELVVFLNSLPKDK